MSKTLELYINKEPGGFHTFIEVVGTRRAMSEGSFSVQSVDEMLRRAKEMLEGETGFEPRLRVYDPGRKMVKGGDGVAWIELKQLKLWTLPTGQRQPQVNEAILGAPCTAEA